MENYTYNLGDTLYKIASTGKIWEWKINVIDNGTNSTLETISGQQNGKHTVTKVDILKGKNTGKANATTHYTQATAQAFATAEQKLRGEYRPTIEELQKQTLRSGIKAPMLAQKLDPLQIQGGKTLNQMKIQDKRVYIQPKYDGNRCLIKVNKDGVELYTRKGDKMLGVKHVETEIFETYLRFFKDAATMPELILDGEQYIHGQPVAVISGLIRKEKRNAEQEILFQQIKFHLYDIMLDVGYEERYAFLKEFMDSSPVKEGAKVLLTPSKEITATAENIDEYMRDCLEEGYEGTMIRLLDMPYENKRSWQLLKYKIFQDAEYELVDIEEDRRGVL